MAMPPLGCALGIDLVTMSKRLGHSSTSVTSDLYQDLVSELDREAADKTADAAPRPGVSKGPMKQRVS